MSSVPAPFEKDVAHRNAVLGRLAWTIPLNTLQFAIVGPLVGTLIALLTPPFGILTIGVIMAPTLLPGFVLASLILGYSLGAIPAALSGFWIALLAPFSPSRKHFFLGAAAIGAASSWIFVVAQRPYGYSGLAILLAILGALSAAICAVLTDKLRHRPFPESRRARRKRRDQLSKARAERLAKQRAAQ